MVAAEFRRESDELDEYLRDRFQLCGPKAQLRCLVAAGGVDDDTASAFAYRLVRGSWAHLKPVALRGFASEDVDHDQWLGKLVRSFARAARNKLRRPVLDLLGTARAVPPGPASSESSTCIMNCLVSLSP